MHFNSRPHEEVDAKASCIRRFPVHFNSRPRKEVDGKTEEEIKATREFQLTTSQGGRRNFFFDSATLHIFQLTTSQGGRLLQLLSLPIPDLHFNSRPHKEVDVIAEKLYSIINISTHDLTRRSTMALRVTETSTDVFQLTTSRRGRLVFAITPPVHPSFNSRPHEEVDNSPRIE